MRGAGIPWIHELLLSAIELSPKKIRSRQCQRPITLDHPVPRERRKRRRPPPNALVNGT